MASTTAFCCRSRSKDRNESRVRHDDHRKRERDDRNHEKHRSTSESIRDVKRIKSSDIVDDRLSRNRLRKTSENRWRDDLMRKSRDIHRRRSSRSRSPVRKFCYCVCAIKIVSKRF